MPNANRFGMGCCCSGTSGHPCLGITFPDTLFMRPTFTYPAGFCNLGKAGTVVNTTYTFTQQSGLVHYFNGIGVLHSYTGNYWASDLFAPTPIDYQTCLGTGCPTYRQFLIVCDGGAPQLVDYFFLDPGDFPNSPWDVNSGPGTGHPCRTFSRSDGASFFHNLVGHGTSPFTLDFTTVSGFSALVTDV